MERSCVLVYLYCKTGSLCHPIGSGFHGILGLMKGLKSDLFLLLLGPRETKCFIVQKKKKKTTFNNC